MHECTDSYVNFFTQIETIGDAYCVAGGLHKKVDSHAKPIAHMALKMMELSEEVLTPDGKPIKVSVYLLSAMLYQTVKPWNYSFSCFCFPLNFNQSLLAFYVFIQVLPCRIDCVDT